jgi:hypothetical protein
MGKEVNGKLAFTPFVYGENCEHLISVFVFPEIGEGVVKSIENIRFCGVPVDEIENIPGWDNRFVGRGIPYVVIKAQCSEKFIKVSEITLTADIEEE